MAKESQENLLPHSEAKVELLKRYLVAYLGVISHDRFTEEICINDLLCGQGLFPRGKPGSPVMIGRLLGSHFNAFPNSPKVTFRFNDLDKKKVEKVYELLQPIEKKHVSKLRLTPSTVPAEEALCQVIAEQKSKKKQKYFNFIDPYGYKDISFHSILRLLENSSSEVLLFQPTTFLFRFSKKGTPLALAEFLEELNDGKPWPEGLNIWGYVQHLTNLMAKKVGDHVFVDCFTIEKERGQVFCLFFFSHHIRGFEKMIDAKWALNGETGRGWHYSAGRGTVDLFDSPNPQIVDLQKHLRQRILNSPTTSNADIYETTLRAGFRIKHANDVLRDWQNQEILKVSGDKVRKGAFYLDYGNHKNEDRIIYFTLLK